MITNATLTLVGAYSANIVRTFSSTTQMARICLSAKSMMAKTTQRIKVFAANVKCLSQNYERETHPRTSATRSHLPLGRPQISRHVLVPRRTHRQHPLRDEILRQAPPMVALRSMGLLAVRLPHQKIVLNHQKPKFK